MSPHARAAQLRAWLLPPAAGTLGADDGRQLQLGLLQRRAASARPTTRRPQPSDPGGLGAARWQAADSERGRLEVTAARAAHPCCALPGDFRARALLS